MLRVLAGNEAELGGGLGYMMRRTRRRMDAFARLVEEKNGCLRSSLGMGFHPDDSREPALNRERKLARVRAGKAHAAPVFDGNDCVGWCQSARRRRAEDQETGRL